MVIPYVDCVFRDLGRLAGAMSGVDLGSWGTPAQSTPGLPAYTPPWLQLPTRAPSVQRASGQPVPTAATAGLPACPLCGEPWDGPGLCPFLLWPSHRGAPPRSPSTERPRVAPAQCTPEHPWVSTHDGSSHRVKGTQAQSTLGHSRPAPLWPHVAFWGTPGP